jgi:hypothetical protein
MDHNSNHNNSSKAPHAPGSGPFGRRHNHHRRGGKFRRPNNGQSLRPVRPGSTPRSEGGKRPARNGRRLPPAVSRNQGLDKLIQKYQNLLLQHHQARRRYFEAYNREKNQAKAEKQYLQCLKELRQFEQSLSAWQEEQFKAHIDPYPPDQSYSQTHPDEKAVEISRAGEFADPHLIPCQKAALWPSGTEESEGTMDDYQKWQIEKQAQH